MSQDPAKPIAPENQLLESALAVQKNFETAQANHAALHQRILRAKDAGSSAQLEEVPEQAQINEINLAYPRAFDSVSDKAEELRRWIVRKSVTDERFQPLADRVTTSPQAFHLSDLIQEIEQALMRRNPHKPAPRKSARTSGNREDVSTLKKRIKELHDAGHSTKEICKRLDEHEFRTPRSTKWKSMTWEKAYQDPGHKAAVDTWISKARKPR